MYTTWESLNPIVQLGAVATALVAVYGLWRLVKQIILSCYRSTVMFITNFQATHKALSKLDRIERELTSTNGGSLRETVIRMDRKMNNIEGLVIADFYTHTRARFKMNCNGECIAVNRAWQELTGRSESEVLGHDWINIIAPNLREPTMKSWLNSVRDGRKFEDVLTIHNHDKRQEIIAKASTWVVRDDRDIPSLFIGEIIPISRRELKDELVV